MMHFIDVFYNKYYLPTMINRWMAKKRNKNTNFSLIVSNCMGGYIYHQLGVPFLSPTINLIMYQNDFQIFIKDIRSYLQYQFVDSGIKECVPTGMLGDVKVYFTHYSSFYDGVTKFEERAKRINWDNLFVITSDRDGVTEEDIKSLGEIQCRKLICFTAHKYPYPFCFHVKEFDGQPCIGSIIGKTISGKWKFEKFFDYVGWLNSEDCIAENFRI